MSVSGRVSGFFRQDGDSVAFTDLVLQDMGDHKTYRVDPTTIGKLYWDRNLPVTVQVAPDGVTYAAPVVGYEVQHLSGYVVFASPLNATSKVKVSGSSFTIAQVGGAYGWSLDMKVDTLDASTFGGNGWKEYVSTFKQYTAKADKFWVNEAEFNLFNKEIIFLYFVDVGNGRQRFEGWGTIQGQSVTVSTGDLIKAPLEITGTSRLWFRRD